MITYNSESKKFSIQTKNSSYFMSVDSTGRLRNLYYGDKISCVDETFAEIDSINVDRRGVRTPFRGEYITADKFTYQEPCLFGEFGDGTRDIQLVYKSHTVTDCKNCQKLSIVLKDNFYNLEVTLNYTVYEDLDLISKNSVITNYCKEPVTLSKIKSGTLYPVWNRPLRLLHLHGMHLAEYQKAYTQLGRGKFTMENHRGVCASHHHVPFFALDEGDATETSGKVWFGLLHWSGDFKMDFEQDMDNQLIASAGVNDFVCTVTLNEGQSFETPLFTVGFSSSGYEKMSENLYDFQYDYLLPQNKIKNVFPVIYNTWYPYYLEVTEERCLGLIENAKKIGAELFVIDDGWFGRRKDCTDGLGDWWCDPDKFPRGLKPVADKTHEYGMKFGLWIEPEMVNPKADLYKKHPEWVLYSKNRDMSLGRCQSVLNLAREDVLEFVWESVDRLISDYELDYLKWDMNTYFTETSVADKDFRIKYINNLYEVWRRINEKYPDVLLENCASGGGRADYGMAPYADRINRSDNSDPVDVLKIHDSFAMIFPPRLAGGAGNISQSPNPTTHRVAPLKYRAHLGMTGSMSVGINILKSSDAELEELGKYMAEYKSIRHITQNAYFYRLSSAYDSNVAVWEYLSRDRRNAIIFVFAHGMNYVESVPRVRLRGLDKNKKYRIIGEETCYGYQAEDTPEHGAPLKSRVAHGDSLMNFDIKIEPVGDYHSQVIKIEEI